MLVGLWVAEVVALVENHAPPNNLVDDVQSLFLGRLDVPVGSDDDFSVGELFVLDVFLGGGMPDERNDVGGALDFMLPLVDEGEREHDEGVVNTIRDDGADGHDGFSETHFVGDESTTHVVEGRLCGFVLEHPLDTFALVLFWVEACLVNVVIEVVDQSHDCVELKKRSASTKNIKKYFNFLRENFSVFLKPIKELM